MKHKLLTLTLLLCALIVGSGTSWGQNTYELVTNVNQLADGDVIIIASGINATSTPSNISALGAANNANNRKAVTVSASNNKITTAVDNANETKSGANTKNDNLTKPLEITLVASNSNWNLKEVLSNGDMYLNGGAKKTSGNNNYLKAAESAETGTGKNTYNGVWSIAINTTTYVATITNGNSFSIRDNSGLFASYSNNTGTDVYIYKKQTNIAVTGVTVAPSTLSLIKGGSTGSLTATVSPNNATNKNVNWSSSNNNIATVSGGTVTPVGIGTCTVTATSAADNTKSGSSTVTVNPAAPVFTVEEGEVVSGTNLKLSNYDSDIDYFYTTDGTTTPNCDENLDPTTNSYKYNHTLGIDLTEDVTIKMIAVGIDNDLNQYKSTVTSAAYTIATDPTAVVSTDALAFGDVEIGKTKQLTFTITPANLTEALTIACANNKYTVSPTSISAGATGEQTITVTAAPTALSDDMDGTITISGGGSPEVSESVTLSCTPFKYYTATFYVNGQVVEREDEYRDGNEVIFPETPAAIAGKKFIGWRTSTLALTNTNPDDYKTEHTISSDDVTFYAVFATLAKGNAISETLSADEIASNFASTAKKYTDDETEYEDTNATWAVKGTTNQSRHWIQIRSNSSNEKSHIKVTTSQNISEVKVKISNASNSSGGIDDITKHGDFAGTLYLSSTSSDNTEPSSTYGSSNSITEKYITIEPTSNTKELYILVNSAARIWEVSIKGGAPDSYSGYCTTIPVPETVTISDALNATWVAPAKVQFGNDVNVYTVAYNLENDNQIRKYEVVDKVVPANAVVLLTSESKGYVQVTATEDAADDYTNLVNDNKNQLQVSDGTIQGNGIRYGLAKKSNVLGFYKVTTGSYIPAGKGYLEINAPDPQNNAPQYLWFDGETTAIDALNGDRETLNDGAIYDLAGRRIVNGQSLPKGIYVQNGKKFIVK